MWRNGRRNGLKIRWAVTGPCRFESGHRHPRASELLSAFLELEATLPQPTFSLDKFTQFAQNHWITEVGPVLLLPEASRLVLPRCYGKRQTLGERKQLPMNALPA